MVTFVTRCELATATSTSLLARRRDGFLARRAHCLRERRRDAGRLQQRQLNDGAQPGTKARHEPPLPLVPVPVPAKYTYNRREPALGTTSKSLIRAPSKSVLLLTRCWTSCLDGASCMMPNYQMGDRRLDLHSRIF